METNAVVINEDALNDLIAKTVVDFGAVWHAGLVNIGDRLGLYKALAGAAEPLTSDALAERTSTSERYVREWLRAQAAGGYVTYHADTDRYSMTPEQAMLYAQEDSPVFMVGGFQVAVGALEALPKLVEAFQTGTGVGWGEHSHNVAHGTARFFRPSYLHYLASEWIPALDSVVDKLTAGARVADIACGYGESTLIMAKAFPASTFVGYDYHDASIEQANQRAREEGLADRLRFEKGTAKSFDGQAYDLITTFDALHDMGDPAGAAAHVRSMLKRDGTWMIVEPQASDRVEDNLNPIGRAFYGASTLVCTPCSLSQDVGTALGAQAGEARTREVVLQGGFSSFRRATETPFNLIYEAKP